jgi:hypothetical protein
MRTALTLAGLALVAGGLAGCGGDDSTESAGDGGATALPTSAERSEFCANFSTLAEDLGQLDPQGDPSEAVRTLQDASRRMRETGTPDDIPADARHGLEVTLDAIDGLPQDATTEDISKLDDDFSEQEKADSDAFDSYLAQECDTPR